MFWRLMHEQVEVEPFTNEAQSRSYVFLEIDGTKITLTDTVVPKNHVLGSKDVLVSAAYKLQDLARQMLSKADKIK
jgi:hypothetical protein